MHGALGRTFALAGRRKQALEVLRKLETYARERYVSPLEFAWIQFGLGETDLGFSWMQKALEDRSFDLISVKVDPRFDALKDDRRFDAIARRMGRGAGYFLNGRGVSVGVGQPETPFQRLEIHVVHVRVVPGGGRVPERRVEDAPLAVGLRPGERKVAVGAMHLGVGRHLRHVEPQQHADLVARVFLRLVELVGERKDRRPDASSREMTDPR